VAVWLAALTLSTSACQGAPGQVQAPASAAQPDPAGIHSANAGEAADPAHRDALNRLLDESWGFGRDRDDQLAVPLPDPGGWKRVRFRPFHFFVGFKYGDEHHALQAVRVEQLEADELADTRGCVRRMERWAGPLLASFAVQLTEFHDRALSWRGQPVLARTVDGRVDYGLQRLEFSAAWLAVPAYPATCAVLAFAVPWRGEPELARRVRDRWVEHAARYVRPLTGKLTDSVASR